MTILLLFSVVLITTLPDRAIANSPPVVSNVTASQRTDGSKLVDIYYDLADPNTGSYNWLVPAVNSDQRLVPVNDAGDPGIFDTSDASFTVELPCWQEQDKLIPPYTDTGEQFGSSVAIGGNTAIVGASRFGYGWSYGRAYLFDVSTGTQLAML